MTEDRPRITAAVYIIDNVNPQALMVAAANDDSTDPPWSGGFTAGGLVYPQGVPLSIAGKVLEVTQTKIYQRDGAGTAYVLEIWAGNQGEANGCVWCGQNTTNNVYPGTYNRDDSVLTPTDFTGEIVIV